MKNIIHVNKAASLSGPHFHLISHNGPVDDIVYYMYVQTLYDFLNKVQYSTLDHISLSKNKSCSTIQFHEGYHAGGKIKITEDLIKRERYNADTHIFDVQQCCNVTAKNSLQNCLPISTKHCMHSLKMITLCCNYILVLIIIILKL